MAGNVWDWCSDLCNEDYYAMSPTRNPQGSTIWTSRVLRGGSWFNDGPNNVRCAYRYYWAPSSGGAIFLCFRCVASPPGVSP